MIQKISRTGLLVTILLGLSCSSYAGSATVVGKPAPDFTLPDCNGGSHHLADYKGKIVVMEWTNPQCPFVRRHYDSNNMQKLQKTYTEKGVIWFSINSSAPGREGYQTPQEADHQRVQSGSAPTAILLDPNGTVGKLYGAKTTPDIFVINEKGILVYSGAIDDRNSTDPSDIPGALNYVSAALDDTLGGRNVTISQTQPYGCAVKYKN